MRVLSYGRVESAEPFERQMEHLIQGYAVVSAAQVLDALEGGRPLPPRAVLLVFRDERSFAALAWPILRRHELAAALFVERARFGETARASTDELCALARQGVALGLSAIGRTHAERTAHIRDLRRSLLDLERVEPGMPRLYAYADGRPDEEEVELVRLAGIELAFTALEGSNDLLEADPMRLRSIRVDGAAVLDVFRAPLESGPTWNRARDAVEPLTPEERDASRTLRARRHRLRFVVRLQDAVLTAGARPRPPFLSTLRALTRRSSHYERLRNLVDLATRPVPALERRLRRTLIDTTRLPFSVHGVELAGHGTAATVFRLLGEPGQAPHVLKVYRSTVGQPREQLVQMARRHRARHELLRQWLGENVLRAHFLVLDGPLRALPVAACLQQRVEGATDLLARTDGELLRLAASRPELRAEFVGFARRVLELRARGFFPDLLGAGNLVLVEPGARIRLLDYGLFDLRSSSPGQPVEALRACAQRFESLLRELDS